MLLGSASNYDCFLDFTEFYVVSISVSDLR